MGTQAFLIGLFALAVALSSAKMIAERRRQRPLRLRIVVPLVAAAIGLGLTVGAASAMVVPGSGKARPRELHTDRPVTRDTHGRRGS